MPLTSGKSGLELVKILEASSESLKASGGPINLAQRQARDFSTAVETWSRSPQITSRVTEEKQPVLPVGQSI